MVRQSPQPETVQPVTKTRGGQRIPRPRVGMKRALADASIEVSAGRTTVVFPRPLGHSSEDVWGMLTDPAKLSLWSPFTADRNLAHVGRATLAMLERGGGEVASVVFVADAPRMLEYSWADDTVTWLLSDDSGSGCLLTLRQTLAAHRMASAIAAGWHLCLEVAASVLDGHPVPPIRGAAAMDHGWPDLNARYATLLGVEPTSFG